MRLEVCKRGSYGTLHDYSFGGRGTNARGEGVRGGAHAFSPVGTVFEELAPAGKIRFVIEIIWKGWRRGGFGEVFEMWFGILFQLFSIE